MIVEALVKLMVSQLAEPLFQEIAITGITTRIKEGRLRTKIGKAISESLTDALNEIPGFEIDLDEKTALEFLNSPIVARELAKATSWHEFPNVGLLRDEWMKKSSTSNAGKVEILLNSFLNRLRQKLLKIPEISETLFQKEMLSGLSNIGSTLDSFQSQFTQFTENQPDQIDGKSKEELELQARLNTCRDYIRRGYPNSSLALLQSIETEVSSKNLSNSLKSQLQGLLGFCYYLLRDFGEAIVRFERALQLNPENPKALANASLAALLDNRLDDAVNRATKSLENGGTDTPARAILTNARAIQKNFENLDDLVNEKALDNIDYVRALGNIFFQAKKFDLAEKYYRLSLAQSPSDFHSLLGLASILTNHIRHPFRFLATRAITEAMTLITAAISEATSGDNEFLKAEAIAARSGMHLARGDLLNAKADCEDVLKRFPSNEIAIHNRSVIALLEGDYKLSIDLLSKLPKVYIIRDKLAALWAEAEIANGTPNRAIEIIVQHLETADAKEQVELKVIQAKALIRLNHQDEALNIYNELLQNARTTEAILGAAEIEAWQGNYSKATDILESAYRDATDESEKYKISLMLAMIYYHRKGFRNSIIWFDLLPREFLGDIELAHRYINALFQEKKYSESYRALNAAREFGIHSSNLLELESWLAEYFGDRKLAITLQKQLVELEPERLNHKIELARLEFRNNEHHTAKETLDRIDVAASEDPNEIMLIAEMYSYIGENVKAIQLAYKARKSGIDIPRIHLTYITLFNRIEGEISDLLSTDIVRPDSAILLKSPNDRFWVKLPVITKPTGDWEFYPGSDTGKLLLGHKKGDFIPFKSTSLESLTYEIQEIQTVYVRAFQESFEEFSTRFPQHEGIQKMDVSDGDISKIVTPLYKRSSYVEQVYDLYKQGQLPLCTVATMVGASQLEVFWTFLADKVKRIYASHGNFDDQNQQAKALVGADSITLDITGLLTLSYLDLLHILNKRYKQVFVHQTLIDEIDMLIISRGIEFKKGARFIGYYDGLPRFEEISPKSIEDSIKFLTDLRSFVREKCVLMPVPPELDNQIPLPDEIRQSIGHLSLSTAMVAKHTKTPLYADDAVIRGIAKQALEVSGAWSQTVLKDVTDRGIITEDAYLEAYAKLAKANYYFIAVNKHLIIFSLKKSTYVASDEKTKATIDGLNGPATNEDDAVNIAADVLREIWLSPITADQKRFILDAILRSLYTGRSNDLVTIKLLRALETAFGGVKDAFHNIANQIRLFYSVINKIH